MADNNVRNAGGGGYVTPFTSTEAFSMANFNSRIDEIDAALKANADAVAAVLANAGNCSLTVQSYTGTGTYGSSNPTRITFAKKPLLFIVLGSKSLFVGSGMTSSIAVAVTSVTDANYSGTTIRDQNLTWSGNTASIVTSLKSADFQFNTKDRVYQVFALYAA